MSQKKHETLQDYKKFQEQLNLQDFVKRFDHPFLIFDKEQRERQTDGHRFNTARFNSGQMTSLFKQSLMKTVSSKMVKVVKYGTDTFKGNVNIGRVSNCDVMIDSPVVSKYHAFFSKNPKNQTYQITDANSTNGTYVNDIKLEPNEKRILYDSDIISLGHRVHISFYTSEGCYDLLKQISG